MVPGLTGTFFESMVSTEPQATVIAQMALMMEALLFFIRFSFLRGLFYLGVKDVSTPLLNSKSHRQVKLTPRFLKIVSFFN